MTAAPNRNRLIAKLHTLKKVEGLDDDTYRAKLEVVTGKRSAADCTDAELEKAIGMFHVKQNGNKTYTRKAKALWISAYLLGELSDGSDAALDAFVMRQTGKLRLQFVTPGEANKVSEALKAICARAGFHPPADGIEARRALLLAQWMVLAGMREVRVGLPDALDGWVSRKYLKFHGCVSHLTTSQLDMAAKALGDWIRQAQKKRGERTSA